ncbi:MAG: YtxH-like protein [Clostridiales bacterium]|jgi:gas vesicle protein|nr:YtxH-like protein [Clostridiales bacterium]
MFLLRRLREQREAELRQYRINLVKVASAAFFIGCTVSALAALLTAPKSGKELRKDISLKVGEGVDKVKVSAEDLLSKKDDMIENAADFGKDLKEKVVSRYKKGEETIEEAVEEASEAVKETVSEGAKVISARAESLSESLES